MLIHKPKPEAYHPVQGDMLLPKHIVDFVFVTHMSRQNVD